MTILMPTCQFRLAEDDSDSFKSDPVIKNEYGTRFFIQQAYIDQSNGETVWKNLEVSWIGDPTWQSGY